MVIVVLIPGLTRALTPQNVRKVETALTWITPPLAIPALRYFQDPPELRKTLFVRDFTTYSIGAGIFLLTGWLTHTALKASGIIKNPSVLKLAAFLTALTANLLYAGVGAIKLSQRLNPAQKAASAPPVKLPSQAPKPMQTFPAFPTEKPVEPHFQAAPNVFPSAPTMRTYPYAPYPFV